jgi:hypothetical protein
MNGSLNNNELDRVLNSIRDDVPSDELIQAAAARVRLRLAEATAPEQDVCGNFRAMADALHNGTLSEARRMLLDDHLHSCVACRRFFKGERAAVIPIRAQRPVWNVMPWAIAAAAIVAVYFAAPPVIDRVLSPSGPRATVASIQGELYRVSATGATLLAPGATIGENEEIRSARNSHAIVKLRDGSSVEMDERTDLTVTERWRGKTVHLAHGAVMVEAAKQRNGRLEIATPDALVSVKGTIFEVASGLKGSRVSVVEGEVKVDHAGDTSLLHRGDQKTTSQTMAAIPVAEAVGWSENSAKYLALLGELSAIQKRIENIPSPALRYNSKLADLLPENTMVFASIPNLSTTLAEATNIFEDRAKQSAVLNQWWNERETQQLKSIVDQVRTFSDYLGDEIVVALPSGNNPSPVLLAEVRRPELREFLAGQFSKIQGNVAPVLIDNPKNAPTTSSAPLVMVHGNIVALALNAQPLARIAALADSGETGAFLSTPFWNRIAQTYKTGAGWVFAVDMEQIVPRNVSSTNAMAGIDNINFLTVERKQNLGRTETSASLDFSGSRHGIMSWLAAPGPMATLDFISPEASFASSWVIKNPATLVQELSTLTHIDLSSAPAHLVTDLAQNLGGEITIAADGPLLPTPSWKAAIEVNNPAAMQAAVEEVAAAASLKIAAAESNGLAYHSLTIQKPAYEIDYTFTDGYMLIASSPALLESAIATRNSGLTLTRSAQFRAQLPQDGHTNFSALIYYNMGSQVGPIIDQLKNGNLLTDEQKKSAELLAGNREPNLIYVYGQRDRIVVASRGGFAGLGLDSLLGLNAKGAAALPQLLAPILNLHATVN